MIRVRHAVGASTRRGAWSARAAVALAALAVACERPPTPKPELVARATFGVFFGGQVEERRDIPFELDTSKQTQGFRIEFANRLASDVEVAWTIDLPGSAAPQKTAKVKILHPPEAHRKKISGKATVPAGLSRFDQMIAFEPGDPLGLWNARVVVQGKVVVDRPFEVYDRGERTRAGEPDGGRR